MKKLLFKYLSRKQRDNVNRFLDFFYIRKVNRNLSFKVRNTFKAYFEGIYDYPNEFDNDCFGETAYIIEPQTTIRIKDLAITALNVYKYKGELTLEITTSRPGICIGKGGNLIDSYREFISENIGQPIKIRLIESKSLFNY